MNEKVLDILKKIDMLQTDRKNLEKKRFYLMPHGIYNISLIISLLGLGVGFGGKFLGFDGVAKFGAIVYLVGCIGLMIGMLIIPFYYGKNIIKAIKYPLSLSFSNMLDTQLLSDKIIKLLNELNLDEVKFFRLHLEIEFEALSKRTELVVGVIQRIGILGMAFSVFIQLEKAEKLGIDWMVTLAYAIPLIYFLGVFANISLVKIKRLMLISDFVIEQKSEVKSEGDNSRN